VRRSLLLLAFATVASTAAAKSSNPAFLGIGMEDIGGTRGIGPCMVTNVESGTGAEHAGLRSGDLLLKLDGKLIANCDVLVAQIQARQPGDEIALDVQRTTIASSTIVVTARLSSRDELLRRKFVGQPVPGARLVNVDDRTPANLAAPRWKTTILGWFSTGCDGCERIFTDVARRARKITRGTPVQVLAASAGDERKSIAENLDLLELHARRLEVPLLVSDAETYNQFTFKDRDRIHFMVIDSRGIVQYVAPIAPDADDVEAMLDELHAAAEQASRR